MPAYPWLFTIKDQPDQGETVVNVPEEYLEGKTGKVVATEDGLHLVAYLQSLKQVRLPGNMPEPDFLYKKQADLAPAAKPGTAPELNGALLYANNCQSCHQANGEGLKGAFPALKDSRIVLDDNPEIMVDIIMNGYAGRVSEGFPEMPPVGKNNSLKPAEIAAIMNHEKTSWGNNAKKVTADQVSKIIDQINSKK